jgi:hypothetical protein
MNELFGSDDEDDGQSESQQQAQVPRAPVAVREGLNHCGGGRGVFATSAVAAGTLILSEIPIAVWPDASSLDDPEVLLNTLEFICSDAEALAASKTLHPRSMESADEADRLRIADVWSIEAIEALCTSVGGKVSRDDVLCLALALQHNGFNSGLYSRLTLVNHSCRPNCIKFMPSSSTGWASEIWTTRPVLAGEELTICYCEPAEMISWSMRAYLQEHHRFACACSHCLSLSQSSPSLTTSSSPPLQEAQEQLEVMERELRFQEGDEAVEIVTRSRRSIVKAEGMLKAVEAALLLASSAGDATCSQDDSLRLRLRLHKFISNSAAAQIQALEELDHRGGGAVGGRKKLKAGVLHTAAKQFLFHSLQLRDAQLSILGDSHPDLAGTYLDVASAFSLLFSVLGPDPAALAGALGSLPYAWRAEGAKAEWARNKLEGQRLSKMFSRHPRYSSLVRVLTRPGDCFGL